LTLVDTGFGLHDVRNPRHRLSGFFLRMLSPDFREEMTALRQIERLGFRAQDVRNIVLTHLDFDHAGGLDDFPWARVHMLKQERDYAVLQKTWLDRQRFRPQQWSNRANWHMHDGSRGVTWLGFEHTQAGDGLPDDVMLVPLPGHTFGHAGVAVRQGNGWLLQAGDAYFFHREMDATAPYCTPGLRLYQTLMEKNRRSRLHNQRRLRELRASHPEVEVMCAHDPQEFERFARRSIEVPSGHEHTDHAPMSAAR
jgi:glyoxylase-like metal-dependent hydrolase (beta-lactamase superfamily II)